MLCQEQEGKLGILDLRLVRRSVASLTAVAALAVFTGPSWAAEDYNPKMSSGAKRVELQDDAFKPDPAYEEQAYDIDAQLAIYGGKSEVEAPRPLFELGRKQYVPGQLPEPSEVFGELNPRFRPLVTGVRPSPSTISAIMNWPRSRPASTSTST